MILFHKGGSKSVVHVQLYNSSEVVHVQVGRLLPFFVKPFDLWTIYFGREIVGTVSGIGILKVQFVLTTYGMTIPKHKLSSIIGISKYIKYTSGMHAPKTCFFDSIFPNPEC